MENRLKMNNLQMMINETVYDFINRLCSKKAEYDITWQQIRNIVYEQTGLMHDESWYRKGYYHSLGNFEETLDKMDEMCYNNSSNADELSQKDMMELKRLAVREREEINRYNADIRLAAREEHLQNLILEYSKIIKTNLLLKVGKLERITPSMITKEGTLLLSDWHYGMEYYNEYNAYNPEIAKERISYIRDCTIAYCQTNQIEKINVLNLGDLISGNIHTAIKLQNRIGLAQQIAEVARILIEMLSSFVQSGLSVSYYSVLDNHSRIDPNKKDALNVDSYVYLIDEMVDIALHDVVDMHVSSNNFNPTVIKFTCLGHRIAGVHGDKDNIKTVVSALAMSQGEIFDFIVSAHLHHFAAEEQGGCKVLCNPSLIGCDEYSDNHRWKSVPGQLFIVSTLTDPVDTIKCFSIPYNN